DTESVLQELLGEELDSEPTTTRGLTNHLPMALVAKQRLGASEEELRRFARIYSKKLSPLSDISSRLDRSTWETAIGDSTAATELREYFARCIVDDGVESTLRSHLPLLIPGLGGAGFHGVIRLAYGIESASSPQIAAGLAYFAEVARPLRQLAPTTDMTDDPEELLTALSTSLEHSTPTRLRLIDDEMRLATSFEGFDQVVGALAVGHGTEEKLAECALRLYSSTNDFTALHGVTGLAALSIVRPWIDDQELIDRFAFQALVAAYISIGAPALWSPDRLDELVESAPATPETVSAMAAVSDDEHIAKFAYTAIQGFERTSNPLYLVAASRPAL
ncbi:MAG TPA: questin oxidase family protein, partial [Acidimicrobiales bacterium]|nr:questin oxidase family protein [Acidimicrobiales bacterium]